MEAEKRRKKIITKKARRNSDNCGCNSTNSGQDSLDDWEVVQPMMEGYVLPEIIERMLQTNDEDRMKDSYMAFIGLGHHLFANMETVNLHKAEVCPPYL
ncbi:putative ensconsin-like [Cocos nucifera]|uniref:Putative ensconsin-like n=1 Tax=Cocos nucifera TaxID=13894 RepID=A0A8K0IJK0_COCNU|nr:putative ensconsin-like [Cocos nucifera]